MIFNLLGNRPPILLFLALFSWGALVNASRAGAESKPIPRKILALYEAKYNEDPFFTSIHQYAEMPLNYLGLEVVFRPVNGPLGQMALPADSEMENYRGILTWFRAKDAVSNPEEYCRWVSRQMQNGKRLVILGSPGVIQNQQMPPPCRQMMERLGLQYKQEAADNPYFFEITEKDPKMVEFEREIKFTDAHTYVWYRPTSPLVKSYLKIRRLDLPQSDSTLVMTSPHGGFAHSTYVNDTNREINKTAWYLNPFLFFEEAYAVKGMPRPDTTTVNGRRIFFSHVDGDGIFNVSLIDRKSYAGEILYDKIFKKYSTIPITASLILGYLDIPKFSGERSLQLYRNIFSLPNIEPASHATAHPLDWQKGTVSLKLPHYHFDPLLEIQGSILRMNSLLETLGIHKTASLFQWSGNCLPDDKTLSKIDSLAIPNINGGDSRYDSERNSYSYVAPLGLAKGSGRQIYTTAPNENIYTNLWRGPYYRYRRVIETFKGTESPLRLKPINIYYHYYSGERIESLLALAQVYDYALSQKIFPLKTSEYVQLANDFFKVEIIPQGTGWLINHHGMLRTIRLDHETRYVDMQRSRGVLGFNHFQGSLGQAGLYVFLDESDNAFLSLSGALPHQPYVIDANFWISNWHARPDSRAIRFTRRGWGKGHLQLGGLPPHKTYHIIEDNLSRYIKSNATGNLTLEFEDSSQPLEVSLMEVTLTTP